jgi:hypothetical protein
MKAIQIKQTGGPEVMSIREVPTPVPGPGEVLIRVAASGVNFIDLDVREGRYANPVPFIPVQEAPMYQRCVRYPITTRSLASPTPAWPVPKGRRPRSDSREPSTMLLNWYPRPR